jgi:antitoxin ParD1/3/4
MTAEKLSITLPADMAQMIRARVESGAYASNSEVIREALRGWMEREQERDRRLESVRQRINTAIDNPARLAPEELRGRLERLHQETVKTRR